MDGSEVVYLLAILLFSAVVVLAIVEGLKAGGVVSRRWAMPAAVVVGIILTGLVAVTDLVTRFDLEDDLDIVLLAGILCGLGASGLYSGVRAVLGTSAV